MVSTTPPIASTTQLMASTTQLMASTDTLKATMASCMSITILLAPFTTKQQASTT